MSQTAITLAFEQHLADLQMGGQSVVPDEFVLANIPGLDINAPINRATGLPAAGQIVHRQMVDQRGKLNANGVAYSIIMDTRIGNFTFNAMYLLHKASGMVAMVVHKESEDKLKNQGPDQPGNSVVKSMLMEYQGAADATNTTVDASTWQIDFSARLLGLDRDMQRHAFDHYGAAAFIADSLSVSAGTGVNEFIVAAGHGYIAGLRAELEQQYSIVVASRPATLYADVYHAGSLLSDWETILTIKASAIPLANYVDGSGFQHYVTPLASLAANGTVTDLRGRGGLWWHERRPQAHTPAQVGLDKLANWDWSHSYTDATGGAAKYATGKAVADAYNSLNSTKLNGSVYTAADVLAKMLTVDGAASGLDADLLDAKHGAYYLAWGNFTGLPDQATRWPTWAEVTDKPAASGVGENQRWVDVKSSRSSATIYTNTTGRPLLVGITISGGSNSANGSVSIVVDDVEISSEESSEHSWTASPFFIVPAGSTYKATWVGHLIYLRNWVELKHEVL